MITEISELAREQKHLDITSTHSATVYGMVQVPPGKVLLGARIRDKAGR